MVNDVQAVFAQISEVTRSVLAHDYLTLGLLSPDGLGFRQPGSARRSASRRR
jgi:hypothetical protein